MLNKLLTQCLQYFLAKEGRLHLNQYGFIPHRSTTDVVYKVSELITGNKEAWRNTYVISLDVKSEFNNVWWPAVLYELEAKYPRNLYKLP